MPDHYNLNLDYEYQEFDEGIIIYILDTGETIQLDSFSFFILELIKKTPHNITSLELRDALLSSNIVDDLTEAELAPFIRALESNYLIIRCQEN
jgi:hypothetical protein